MKEASSKRLTDPAPVDNLVSVYVARRELVPVLVGRFLVPAGLAFEEAELMLELFGSWKLGWEVPTCDSEGYVIQKALEKILVNSQPHVSRRVGQLAQRGYVVTKRVAHSGILRKANKVRLSQSGQELTASLWENYKRLSEKILQSVPPEQRLKHYLVCRRVCARIRPGDYLEQTLANQNPEAGDNLVLLFKMAREVRKSIVLLQDIPPQDRKAHIDTNDAIVQALQPYGKRDSIRRVG